MATDTMKIIVGLGNPGKEYEDTYHNTGFLALDVLVAAAAKEAGEPAPTLKKHKSLFDFCIIGETAFVRPLTYMNESGKAVKEAVKKFDDKTPTKPEDITILQDDSDLTIGTVKKSFARSSAGHKGVQSIIDALHTNAFYRIRIGIRPAREAKRRKAGEFALKKITKSDHAALEKVFEKIYGA